MATKDYHIDPGAHFGNPPDFVDSWPVHCVVGTPGSDFHPALDTDRIEAIFTKGAHEAAYSGFEGHAGSIGLAAWLRMHDVTDVDVVGIATDHCVRATALDADPGRLRHHGAPRPDRRRGAPDHRRRAGRVAGGRSDAGGRANGRLGVSCRSW